MSTYIDADRLYNDTVKWESAAMDYLLKLDPNKDREKYLIWNAILGERTSFKHDISDAPQVEFDSDKSVVWAHWKEDKDEGLITCSNCGAEFEDSGFTIVDYWTYCPHCGAKMRDTNEEAGRLAPTEFTLNEVAQILRDLFDDECACNYNGIDEWLPLCCSHQDDCPFPKKLECWKQYLIHLHEKDSVIEHCFETDGFHEFEPGKVSYNEFEANP